jgi:NADH-quinone oxidoreductase subunit K
MSLLVLTSALLCIGLYGVLTRRDLVALLASVEVMLGAGTIQLAAFSTALRASAGSAAGAAPGPSAAAAAAASATAAAAGQGYTLAILVLAAAEAAIGLALLVVLVRSGRTRTDQIEEVRG